MSNDFSIQTLASRTGVTTNVLRTWENRFGFPAGQRTAAGHRRFTDEDVARVHEVLLARESGIPLQLAIDSVLRRHEHADEVSVHGALVREFPELAHQRLSREALVAASHALEDETLARAEGVMVLGAFQAGHRFAEEQHRWNELARTATWCAVVADFDETEESDLRSDPQARPARCHLPANAPMRREWTVVSLGAAFGSVLSAWEVPSAPGQPTRFEAVISTQRRAALVAARVITGVAEAAGATPPNEVRQLLIGEAATDAASAGADRLWLRALANLDGGRA